MMTQTLSNRKKGAGFGYSGSFLLKTAFLNFLAALWCSGAAADSLPPRIQMDTIAETREMGVVKAMIMDDSEVSRATLFYRKSGEIRYNSIEMKERNDIWYRELKRDLGLDGIVEYYILAQDKSGNESTEPTVNPTERPLRAAMDPVVNQAAEEVVLASPEAGTLIVSGDQMVIITFYKTDREVDMNTVRLKIDDRDRTREVEFKGNMALWQPKRTIPDGQHVIEVIARDTAGNNVGPNVWTFQVKSKMQLPLGAKGNFFMGLQRDDRSNEKAGPVPPWNNKIDMGLNGEKGSLFWEAGVMLTSEESGFLTSEKLGKTQPVNRYYATLRSRNFRIHLGDDNPNFSDLSMKGILVRGLSASFKSNRFNADLVYGYNKRDIGEDIEVVQGISNVTATNYLDDSGNVVDISSKPFQRIAQDASGNYRVYEFGPGTFRRNVTALKLDIAPVRNKFAAWNFGVNLFSAEDDTTSLTFGYDPIKQSRYFQGPGNQQFATGYNPKKNWVGTVETTLKFNNNRTVFSAEFGGTVVTENMFSVVSEDIKDELPDQIDDSLFRFNGSTQTSFDKMKLKDNIGSGLVDALTSVYMLRLMTPIPVPMLNSRFKVEVYHIPTHYVSLGNPHQRTDIGGYKLDLKNQILRDQVSLDFGYEAYNDNLNGERKQYADTTRTMESDLTKDTKVASATVSYRPQILPEYAPNVSLGYRNYTTVNNLDLAYNPISKLMDMFTNTLMLNLGATLPVGLQRHTGTLSISSMKIGDNRAVDNIHFFNYNKNESNNATVILNVNSSINPLPLALNTTIGKTGNKSFYQLNDANNNPYRKGITTDITMLNLAATYKWLRDKRLSTTAGFGYIGSANGQSGVGKVENAKTTFRAEAEYKLNEMSVVGADVRIINYSDKANPAMEYSEPILGITLKSNF